MNLSIILLVFGVVFIAELPDKSMFASLALSTRYRKLYVWMGAAAAFLVHVIIAVTAGHFLTLLPKQVVEIVVAVLFAVGAGLLLFGKNEDEEEITSPEEKEAKRLSHSFLKVFTTSFLVVFLGEWGDITQIATANYAAKYHDALSVGIGAVLGLWTVAAFGVIVGSKVLNRIPARTVQRLTGVILLLFAILSAVAAFKG
jgi:putative Ca2+/H+ antiporter (TMEM165/GDT1 family)